MGEALDKLTKLDGRLRCVANGKTEVNAVRAQQNGAVRLTESAPQAVQAEAAVLDGAGRKTLGLALTDIERGKSQGRLSADVEVNVFVLFNRLDSPTPPQVTRRNGRVGLATVTLAELKELDENPFIEAIELGETLKAPDPTPAIAIPEAPPEQRFAALNGGKLKVGTGKPLSLNTVGKNVLVGIIDVGGIDFAHPDFLDDNGKSRVIAIWDQGGDAFDPPFLDVFGGQDSYSTGYGSEITAKDIELATQIEATVTWQPTGQFPGLEGQQPDHWITR